MNNIFHIFPNLIVYSLWKLYNSFATYNETSVLLLLKLVSLDNYTSCVVSMPLLYMVGKMDFEIKYIKCQCHVHDIRAFRNFLFLCCSPYISHYTILLPTLCFIIHLKCVDGQQNRFNMHRINRFSNMKYAQ